MAAKDKTRHAAYMRDYYQRNKTRLIEQNKAYRAVKREAGAAYARAYREEHKDEIKEARTKRRAERLEEARIRSRLYYAANKEKAAAQARIYRSKKGAAVKRANNRKRNYGLTVDDFHQMWNLQAGRCQICICRLYDDGSRQVHVDHDHKTGEVRGLLCVDCNVGLGRFKDNPQALLRAAAFVRREL